MKLTHQYPKTKNLLFLAAFVGIILLETGLQAAVAPNNQTTGPITLAPGETLTLPITVGSTYFIEHTITGGGSNTITVPGGATIEVRSGGQFVMTNPNPSTFTTSGASWNGIRFRNNGVNQLHNCNLVLLSPGAIGMNFVNTNPAGTNEVINCTIGSTGNRPSVGIVSSVAAVGQSHPTMIFNQIFSSTNGVRLVNASTTAIATPPFHHNYLDNSGTNHIFYLSNPVSTFYAELNATSTGTAPTVQTFINASVDASPYLLTNPITTGGSSGNPLRIQGGTQIDFPGNVDLLGTGTTTQYYYRLDGGDLTVASGATLRMGFNSSGTAVGGTYLTGNLATNDLIINGNFTSTGIATNANQISGTWGSLQLNAGSSTDIDYMTIRDGTGIIMNGTGALNLNRVALTNNTTGIQINGTATPVVTNTDIFSNTTDINFNVAGTLTIENVYWGANPPSPNFAAVGAIDFEPWAPSAYGFSANPGTTSQAPQNIDANSPSHNSLWIGAPTQIAMSATDVGLYNGQPLEYVIEIATDSGFGSIFERFDPNGLAGGNLSAGTMVGGPFYNSGSQATYNIATALTSGVYYYRVRGYDRLGSVSLSTAGGQLTPAPNGLQYTQFTVGNASVSLSIAVNNITKSQYPASNADAGDILEYIVTFNNTGLAPANNAVITNVLPTDVIFIGTGSTVSHNIYFTGAAPTITVTAYSDNAGVTQVGQDINAPVSGTSQAVNWGTDPLTTVEATNTRRISFLFSTLEASASGNVSYRVRVR